MRKLYDVYTWKEGKTEVYASYAIVSGYAKRIFSVGRWALHKDYLHGYVLSKRYF